MKTTAQIEKGIQDIEDKAANFREVISNISDEALVFFSHAVFAGEAKALPFESAQEFIERTADKHVKSLPF